MNTQSDQWFFIRNNLSESSGEVGHSPDIFLAGDLVDMAAVQNYGKDSSQEIKYSESNNIYVRAKNKDTKLAKGNISVYVTYLTSLSEPQSWVALKTPQGSTSVAIAATGGAIDSTDTPFLWNNVAAPASGVSYCVIAVVTDAAHPRVLPPSSVKDTASFNAWIAQQGTIAYRIFEASIKPIKSPFCSWVGAVKLNNAKEESMLIQVTCGKIDAGAELELRLDYPDVKGNVISIGGIEKVAQVYSVTPKVAANFVAKITVDYFTSSSENVKGVAFNLKASTIKPSGGDDLGEDTVTLVDAFDVAIAHSTK